MNVVGKFLGTGKDKETGKEFKYARIYVTYPNDHTEGMVAEEIKVKPDQLNDVMIGDDIEIGYNKYGKAERIFHVGQF